MEHKRNRQVLLPPDIRPKLCQLEARGISVYLTDCIEKLEIIQHVIPEKLDIELITDISYKPLDQRLRVPKSFSFIFPNIDGPKKLTDNQKLQRDRTSLQYIIQQALNEIELNNSFQILECIMFSVREHKRDEIKLLREYKKNSELLLYLENRLPQSEKELIKELGSKNLEVNMKSEEYHDEQITEAIKLRFIRKYEDARVSLQRRRISDTLQELEDDVEKSKQDTEIENRAHAEISKYIDLTMSDMEAEIESWMVNYDKDMEQKENETMKMKLERENVFNETASLFETYTQHQKAIDDYKQHKEELRIAAEKLLFEIGQATKIQAWWRGMMVRKKLGPYAPKNAPKVDPKAAKKDDKTAKKKK